MAKTNHKFPDHANRNYYERDTEFEVLLNSLYRLNLIARGQGRQLMLPTLTPGYPQVYS